MGGGAAGRMMIYQQPPPAAYPPSSQQAPAGCHATACHAAACHAATCHIQPGGCPAGYPQLNVQPGCAVMGDAATDGRCCGSFYDDESDLLPHHSNKKVKHNIAERRRTSRLNSLFEELDVLAASRPDLFCYTGQRHSKADVLINSVSCMRHLFGSIDQLKMQLRLALGGDAAEPCAALPPPAPPMPTSVPTSMPPAMTPAMTMPPGHPSASASPPRATPFEGAVYGNGGTLPLVAHSALCAASGEAEDSSRQTATPPLTLVGAPEGGEAAVASFAPYSEAPAALMMRPSAELAVGVAAGGIPHALAPAMEPGFAVCPPSDEALGMPTAAPAQVGMPLAPAQVYA